MSRSSYIIICDGQIAVLAADSVSAKIAAISSSASQLVQHIESIHPELTQADVQAITDLQHAFMEEIYQYGKRDVQAKIEQMVGLMRDLEEKFD